MRTINQTGLLFLLAAVIAGCGGTVRESSGGGGGATGRLSVISNYQAATRRVPGYADTLRVTVTPPAGVALPGTFPNPFLLNRFNGTRTLEDLAPSAQPYVLDMQALTDGTVVGTVQRSIVISAGDFVEIDVSANLQSAVASVTVEGVSLLQWGNSTQLTAFAQDAQGATLFSGAGFTWASSDPGLLSVGQDTGLATGKILGTATVTAALSGTSLAGQLGVTVNSKIAFESDRNGNAEIYVMNADGSGLTNLTNRAASDFEPSFGPDGSKIAFDSDRDGNGEIYVMNADGTGVTRLTNNVATDFDPAFSPDGLKIAFQSLRDAGNSEIYIVNVDGTGVTNLTNNAAFDSDPAFSPDGSRIAFSSFRDGSCELYAMNVDGTVVTRLTNNTVPDVQPAFSPDGSKIAFASFRAGNWDIYVMNANGTGETRLTNDAATNARPAFSPDGSKIAFWSDRDGNMEIYVMNADGSVQTRLTNSATIDTDPSFPLP